MSFPGYLSSTIPPRTFTRMPQPWVPGGPVTVDSAEVSTLTPTWKIPAGTVVVLRTSTGRYVMAGHASGDRNTPAIVTASETADADWQSATITFEYTGKKGLGATTITVTLGAADDTDAEVVTALNANKAFQAAGLYAYASGSLVNIRTPAGKGHYLKVTSSLSTAFGASGTAASGANADYRVLASYVDLQDRMGSAVHGDGATVLAAAFKTGNLTWHASVTDAIKAEAYSALEEFGANFAA